jgi:hypothetical protein
MQISVVAVGQALLVLWTATICVIVVVYFGDLRRLWREPVFRYPVLIIESDDWGAGPLVQASALDDMAAVLRRFRDSAGRPPVMSLAVVLAVPDGPAIDADATAYRRRCLDDPLLAPVLDALRRGQADGSFSLQLHGLEHFWPATLMGSEDPRVRDWLREPSPALTECLPPHLQSRWTDASRLPSLPLSDDAIHQAVRDEVAIYGRVIGHAPTVVVPPTFVWTPVVERAWAANGIECVVTPGQRYSHRAADGSNVADVARFVNGDSSAATTYLVRYDYFEPARGRDAEYALCALRRASAEGRPCVLENHRINFCQEVALRVHSLQELEKLVAGALKQMPTLRFMSSSELFRTLKGRDRQWVVARWGERFPYFWQRLRHTGRLWKLLKLTGAALPGLLLMRWTARVPERSHA